MKEESAAWLVSSEQDLAAAHLLAANGFFSQAVFYMHLSVEKTLKAMVVERADARPVPQIHDLVALLRLSSRASPSWLEPFLVTLSNQSTASRYTLPPHSSRYNADVATALLEQAERAIGWLRQQLT